MRALRDGDHLLGADRIREYLDNLDRHICDI